MNDPKHSLGSDQIRFGTDSGSLEDFVKTLETTTDPADWPRADGIKRNVPVYDGDAIRDLQGDARRALMAEWARAFLTGPGIIVIQHAFADAGPLDRATALFQKIIADQRDTGAGGGDHFARPGANDRVWNALQKHCLADPEGFALYYGNTCIAMAAEAWLGPNYQFTAQVNRVNPGGAAQSPHRDYHLGFMTAADAARYPAHAHRLSPALTLQGAVAHCDMPVQAGPTMYLPYSQRYEAGYIAFARPEFQDYFAQHHVQLPLSKGDVVFFNPALMHGAGTNRTADIYRLANLLQVSSAFGRPIETVDRAAMARALYAPLQACLAAGDLTADQADAAVAACAEGYAYPTNLDTDPPVGGLAPLAQAAIMREALANGTDAADFATLIDAWQARRQS